MTVLTFPSSTMTGREAVQTAIRGSIRASMTFLGKVEATALALETMGYGDTVTTRMIVRQLTSKDY